MCSCCSTCFPSVDFRHFLEKCVMNNYFGIGLDAKISLEFNNKRDEHPKKCRLAGTPRFPPGKNMYPSFPVSSSCWEPWG